MRARFILLIAVFLFFSEASFATECSESEDALAILVDNRLLRALSNELKSYSQDACHYHGYRTQIYAADPKDPESILALAHFARKDMGENLRGFFLVGDIPMLLHESYVRDPNGSLDTKIEAFLNWLDGVFKPILSDRVIENPTAFRKLPNNRWSAIHEDYLYPRIQGLYSARINFLDRLDDYVKYFAKIREFRRGVLEFKEQTLFTLYDRDSETLRATSYLRAQQLLLPFHEYPYDEESSRSARLTKALEILSEPSQLTVLAGHGSRRRVVFLNGEDEINARLLVIESCGAATDYANENKAISRLLLNGATLNIIAPTGIVFSSGGILTFPFMTKFFKENMTIGDAFKDFYDPAKAYETFHVPLAYHLFGDPLLPRMMKP